MFDFPECSLACESTERLGASNLLNKHSLPRIKYVDQRLILEYFLNSVIPELSIARSDRLPFEKYYEHPLLLATLFLFLLRSHSKNELWFDPRLDDCILADQVLEHADESILFKIAAWFSGLPTVQVLLVQGKT